MLEILSNIAIQTLLAGGGGAFVAYTIFKNLGAKWLDNKFAEKLENFRHHNAKEIARMKIEIDGSIDAVLRVQQQEFIVISESWSKLQQAYGLCVEAVNPFQSQPDFTRMSEIERKATLDLYEFSSSEVERLSLASDKMDHFYKVMMKKKFSKAKSANQELRNYLFLNELFLSESVSISFRKISDNILSIWQGASFKYRYDVQSDKPDDHWGELTEKVAGQINDLALELRKIVRR